MQQHDLRPAPGAKTNKKRVGRGTASGKGKTAGRGTKGQKARGSVRPGFEGGQNPLYRRMSYKRGFTNIFRTEYAAINLDRVLKMIEKHGVTGPISPEVLYQYGVTRGLEFPVKIMGVGEVTQPLTVRAHKFTGSAREKIEAAGGTVEVIE